MAAASIIPAHHRFVKAIATALRHRCRVGSGAKVLAAVSGGGDSVALVRALTALAPRRRWNLHLAVAHVQHHLRDLNGDGECDALFTQQLAGRLGLPFYRRDLDLTTSRRPSNTEARARSARYQALGDIAHQCGAQFVATAHHGDDQLETLLMRLLRGASVRGMSAIVWRRCLYSGCEVRLIRPMLNVQRADVITFLDDLQQDWRQDHTNYDVTRLRARLRRDVLPVLRAIRPGTTRGAQRVAEHMYSATRLLDETVDHIAHQVIRTVATDTFIVDRPIAQHLQEIVLTELIRRQLLLCGAAPDSLGHNALAPVVIAVRDHQGGRRRFTFSGAATVTITRQRISIRSGSEG